VTGASYEIGTRSDGGQEHKDRRSIETEVSYQRLFESVGVGVALIGPEEGVIVCCNPAYASILGSTPEEVEGRSFFEFLEEEQEAKVRRERGLRLRGIASEYEVTVAADDGEERHLLATGVPLYDDRDGSYLGAAQTVQDVTAKRLAEAALREVERRHRFAFEEAPVGMALLNPDDGRWLAINPKLCRILGYSQAQLLSGMTWRDLTHPDDLEADTELAQSVLAGELGSYSIEKRYLRKDGRVVWARLAVSLKRRASGKPDCFFSIVEDITEEKVGELVSDPLTSRELQILELAASWFTDQEIARKLGYSEGTIKAYVRRILRKLGVEGRRQAVKKAAENGLITLPKQPR